MTRGPSERVAHILALFREVADEIVVAVDDRIEPDLIGPLEDVADVLVAYPYAHPVDRPVGWLHALCSGRWILNVDDDELPSAQLLAELPALVSASDVTHYYVPRRWPFPDPGSLLDEPPWHIDWQLRLVSNDARLLWFPGTLHWPIQATGPHRLLDAPLYHLDLLLNDREARAAKAERYERELPGRRLAGLPMNRAVHLPEVRSGLALTETPEHDRSVIEAVLAVPPWPEQGVRVTSVWQATREEVDAHYHGHDHGDALYRATLSVAGAVAPFHAGETRQIPVVVENGSPATWPWGGLGTPDIRLSYRWLDRDGAELDGVRLRTTLPHRVDPGGTALVAASVTAPDLAGEHVLSLDLVREHVRWFECGHRVQVEVRPSRRIGVVADDEVLLRAAAAAIVELLPETEPVVIVDDPARAHARLGYNAVPTPHERVLGHSRAGRVGTLARGAAVVTGAWRSRDHGTDDPFLDGISRCGAVLVVGDTLLGGSGSGRHAWQQAVVVLAASTRGLPVQIAGTTATGTAGARKALARLALARAHVTVASADESSEEAIPRAVAELGGRLGA